MLEKLLTALGDTPTTLLELELLFAPAAPALDALQEVCISTGLHHFGPPRNGRFHCSCGAVIQVDPDDLMRYGLIEHRDRVAADLLAVVGMPTGAGPLAFAYIKQQLRITNDELRILLRRRPGGVSTTEPPPVEKLAAWLDQLLGPHVPARATLYEIGARAGHWFEPGPDNLRCQACGHVLDGPTPRERGRAEQLAMNRHRFLAGADLLVDVGILPPGSVPLVDAYLGQQPGLTNDELAALLAGVLS